MIEDVDSKIKGGSSFSVALLDYRGMFSKLYISLVKSGKHLESWVKFFLGSRII